MIKRSLVLFILSLVWLNFLLSIVLVSCSPEASGPKNLNGESPNILFIVADDLGYEKLGCYAGINTTTPNLDELARKGVLFENAYTSPVCTPSRMSIYTGSYEPRHKYSKVLPVHLGTKEAVDFTNRFTCYAKLFKEAGYLTSVTGKWQLATLEYHPDHIKSAGFESWCVWQIWRDGQKTTRYWNPTLNHDGDIMDIQMTDFGPDLLTKYVIEQMRSANEAGKPFLIHHNMMLPHWPIIKTPADKEKNQEASLDNMIHYMDLQIGKLMTAISELGIEKNTIVFFAGDNGTDMNQPRQTLEGTVTGGKRDLNNGGMHVPLIVVSPGLIPENRRVSDLIDFVDLFPTFCEIANIEIPEEANPDGISFVDPLLGIRSGQRKWVTGGINEDFCVFDGQWRIYHKNDSLVDCRKLPLEKPAELKSNEAKIAKARLLPILRELRDL